MSPFLSGTTPENDVSADVSADVQDQEQSLSPSNSNYVENPSKSNFVVSDASVPAQLEQAVAGAHDIIHDAAPLLSSARSPIIRADLCTVAGGALPRPESVSRAESAAVPQVSTHEVSNLGRLLPHVLLFTQRPYDFLERRVEEHREQLAKQSVTVVFHSPHPLCILLHRKRVAFLLLLLASLHLAFALLAFSRQQRPIRSRAFRFTALELRSGAEDVAAPSIAAFRVLLQHRRCLRPAPLQRSLADGAHLYALFDSETRLDGFSIVMSLAPPDLDPARFEVSFEDADGAWHAVAFHRSVVGYSGQREAGRRVELPEERGEVVTYDLRAARA